MLDFMLVYPIPLAMIAIAVTLSLKEWRSQRQAEAVRVGTRSAAEANDVGLAHRRKRSA